MLTGQAGNNPDMPPLLFGLAPTEIEIVGLFEPLDSNAGSWSGSGLLLPTLRQGRAGVDAIYATAYVPAKAYANLQAGLLPFRYDWRYEIDPDRLDADQVAELRAGLRHLDLVAEPTDSRYLSSLSSVVNLDGVVLSSGLLGILDSFAEQRARSESVLSIAALGPLGLACAAIGMFAVLLVRRRRTSLLLARGRGASGTLILGVQLLEALLLAGGASLVGLLIALTAVPARAAPLSPILALAVAAASLVALVAATWPAARRPLIQLERDDPAVLRVPARRLVIEATIVGIALLAAVLLRERGLTLGQSDDSVRFDPLLAAVPLLIGLAAGIVAMRLYPLPVRTLGWLAARRRDFVPVIALRTVARHPAVANLPLLVLLFTAAFAAFASVVASSIERGQVAASYLDVGADYRLEAVGASALPAALDPTSIPGVEAAAAGAVNSTAAFIGRNNQPSAIDLDAIDPIAYARVAAGTAADPKWPDEFVAQPPATGVGTAASPIPALVSNQFPPGSTDIGIGGTFTAAVAGQPLSFRLIGRSAGLAGFGTAANFALVPLDWITAALPPDAALRPTVMWLRAAGDVTQPLADALSGITNPTRIVTRAAAYATLHGAPLGTAVADGFGIAVGVAVVYLAAILIAAVAMSAAESTRDLAYLRTLGVSGRQALGLTAVEQAPPVLLALVPGVVLGIGVAVLVEPGLGLADFAGAAGLPLFVDWLTLLLVVAAMAAVVSVAIAAGTWLAWRARLMSALRIGES